MLILPTGEGEIIEIGDGITVTVIALKDGKAILGVTVPADVQVCRPPRECKDSEGC